jgi:hypothetical protein
VEQLLCATAPAEMKLRVEIAIDIFRYGLHCAIATWSLGCGIRINAGAAAHWVRPLNITHAYCDGRSKLDGWTGGAVTPIQVFPWQVDPNTNKSRTCLTRIFHPLLRNSMNALWFLNIPGISAKYKVLPSLAERALVPSLAFPGETFGLWISTVKCAKCCTMLADSPRVFSGR